MDTLPTELLTEICYWAIAIDPRSAAQLQLVSRKWAGVVTSFPHLFQYLSIGNDDNRSTASLQQQEELWIKRSYPMKFDTQIEVKSIDSFLPMITPLLPHVARWRAGNFMFGMNSTRATFPEEGLLPDTLVLRTFDGSELQDNGSDVVEHLPMFYTHETARMLSLRVDATRLPAPSAIAPSPFTHLTVVETTSEAAVHPADVLRLLTCFPSLVAFDWTSNGESAAHIKGIPFLPDVVKLPKLTELTIRSTPAIRPFLSRINAPALRSLLLDNINVGHPLDDGITEEGDSDDETDFSQSPHSDRATGMGLRHLLDRAQVGLERLDMDYADMRSKDFRWCFDHLDHLTALRLVGSDIADNVFRLLCPYTPAHDGENTEPAPRLRLPMLSELELIACSRLSGDLIVNVLRLRDALARSSPSVTQLKSVRVVGCPNFEGEHEHELKRVFGERLSFDS
jgi:hypothetical protein